MNLTNWNVKVSDVDLVIITPVNWRVLLSLHKQTLINHSLLFMTDFTRLKLVQGKKEDATNKENDAGQDNDMTANYDAQDDRDVVF